MQQSSRRFMSMMLALLFAIGAIFVLIDMVMPEYGNLENLKGKEIGSQELLQNETTLVKHVQGLVSQTGNDQGAVADLAIAMPTGPNIAGAVAQVYGIATNDGIAVTSISISAPRELIGSAAASTSTILKPEGSLSLGFQGSGTYESLKSFLADLESNIRIFDVNSLTVTPSAPLAAPGITPTTTIDMFKYSFSATTYYELP